MLFAAASHGVFFLCALVGLVELYMASWPTAAAVGADNYYCCTTVCTTVQY